MKTKSHVFVFVISMVMLPVSSALADAEECQPTPATQKAAEAHLKKAEGMEKAGKFKQAFDATMQTPCYKEGSAVEKGFLALRKRVAKKLGEAAEKKGQYDEAYEYFYNNQFGVEMDRVVYRKAAAKPDDFARVQKAVNYLRGTQEDLKNPNYSWSTLPDRGARMKAIPGYLDKLRSISIKNGNKYLADDEQIFKARNTSLAAKSDSLSELSKARDWLGLFGQSKLANDRALQHGDALAAKDTRTLLRLAISYYQFAGNEQRDKKVKEKARRLGDASLKKGDKKVAAEFYAIAGMGDKSSQLEESYAKEKEKAESKRQDKFKKDQDSLEKELGM
jgi:hypothetical protein